MQPAKALKPFNLTKLIAVKPAITFLFLFAYAGILAAQPPVEAVEDDRFRAQVRKDIETLSELLSDDLVYIHSNTLTENKADFLKNIASGKIVYQEIRAVGERSYRYLGRVALSNGTVHVKVLFEGNPFEAQLRYTAVYHKQKNRWLLVSWQSTKVP